MRALLTAFSLNKPAFGIWLSSNSSATHARSVVQAAQSSRPNPTRNSPNPLSWVLIDCEHGLTSLVPGVAECVAGVYGAASSVLVRIAAPAIAGPGSTSTTWQIKQALDAGALGVMVPMVSTVKQAVQVVSDARFAPLGRRGFGNPYTPAIWGHSHIEEFVREANEHVQVMIQIETKEGLENVRDLASVEGVDVLAIGPYDLSLALGYPPPSPDPHPEVEAQIQLIKDAAHLAGKKCLYYCINGEQAAMRAKEGFDMICVTSDAGSMADGITMHMRKAMEGL